MIPRLGFLTTSLLALAACGSDPSPSPNPPPATTPAYVRTYTVVAVDTAYLPYVVTQVGNCQSLNTGGWLTLDRDGSYQFLVDNTVRVCPGAQAVSEGYIGQLGTYSVSGPTVTLSPAPTYGPAGSATFWPATSDPGGGFTQATLTLILGSHTYAMVALGQPPSP